MLLRERGLGGEKQATGFGEDRLRTGILRHGAAEHRLECFDGVGGVAGARERQGFAVPRIGEIGVRSDGFVEAGERRSVVAAAREHGREAVERPGIGGLQL